MGDPRQPHVWWRGGALACALLAGALPFVARAVAGPRGADVHVEWQPSVDEATRQQLAARYRLDKPRKLEDTYTWRYDLTDPSRDNIRALVSDPAVNDTHEIDRNEYTLAPTAPRTARRQRFAEGGDTLVGIADALAIVLLAFTALTYATRTTPGRLLQRGIPEVDARTAGLFRIVFGAAVLAFFASHRVDASWVNATFDLEIEGRLHAAVIEWLRGHPAVVDLLTPWLLTMGVAFTAGLFTRFTYALFVAGALIWAYVAVSLDSTHPHGTLILALVALLPSRWGDALSVDSWLRRTRGQAHAALQAGRRYGYTVWVPGLAFGVGYAAASWAKLTDPPGWTDWILNGTVKYHFITDSAIAPVDWGLQLAHYPRLAIVASLFAVAAEALVVTAAFARSEIYRLALGLTGVGLIGGFWVFMGHFWAGWWILLLGFLPWQHLSGLLPAAMPAMTTADAMARPFRLSTWQFGMIAGVIIQQVVFSNLQIERAPMFSHYPMYATTYSSPAAYEASKSPRYRIVASTDRGNTTLRCPPHDEFVREFEAALDGSSEARSSVWRALRGCGEDLSSVRYVTLEGDVRAFDWDRLEFTTRAAAVLGPLPADEGGIASPLH